MAPEMSVLTNRNFREISRNNTMLAKVLILAVGALLLVLGASPLQVERYLQHGPPFAAAKDVRGATAACTRLCWTEPVEIFRLLVTYVLNSCGEMNVTQYWELDPTRNNWLLIALGSKGSYRYRNSWTDFSLGDEDYSFQSWRTRWFWNLDFTELTETEIYETDATETSGLTVYDSIRLRSTVYRVFNRTAIVAEETTLQQDIPFTGPVVQTVEKYTTYYPVFPCNPEI